MGDAAETVLVIEDEAHTRRALTATLRENGYRVFEAATAEEGVTEYFLRAPGVVLLDLGLPDRDGGDVTAQLREHSEVPIIVVSARGEEDDQIEALDRGANDYVMKPFRPGELLARVRVAFRTAAHVTRDVEPDPFRLGDLRVERAQRRVFLGDREITLTPTEYKLLVFMIRHAGRVVTHQQILREVWGPAYVKEVQYLRVYMRQLRYKLEPEPAQPRYLVTASGVGYRFKVDELG